MADTKVLASRGVDSSLDDLMPPVRASDLTTTVSWGLGRAGLENGMELPVSAIMPSRASTDDKAAVLEMPAAPSSAKLFLTAVVSVGAWHLLRSARHLNIAIAPEWFHDGSPDRIGHVVRINLDLSVLTLCEFELSSGETPQQIGTVQADFHPLGVACRGFLIEAARRGPPPSLKAML